MTYTKQVDGAWWKICCRCAVPLYASPNGIFNMALEMCRPCLDWQSFAWSLKVAEVLNGW